MRLVSIWRRPGSPTSESTACGSVLFWALALAVVLWIFMEYAATGRRLYATGFNMEAARLANIRVNRLRFCALLGPRIGGSAVDIHGVRRHRAPALCDWFQYGGGQARQHPSQPPAVLCSSGPSHWR